MVDAKTLFTEQFDAARVARVQHDDPAAAELLRSAIVTARSDPSLRRELASALFSLGRASRKFGAVGEAEAGPLLDEALAISEELFGREGAGLAPLLQELSRLHLQQSQHSRAQDAIGRLLAITRAKGDEHPDVATALADLAFVKRKLGDDASAAVLYRDSLRIRERVLEHDHPATVGTRERLSETCAALGNFAEAIALLHIALPAREAALGAGHERVLAARSRVAEYELQAAAAADAASPEETGAAQTTPGQPELVRDFLADGPLTTAPSLLDAKGETFLNESEPQGLGASVSAIAPVQADLPTPVRKKRTGFYASAGLSAVAIAIAVLLMVRPSAGKGMSSMSTQSSAPNRSAAVGARVEAAPTTTTVASVASVAAVVAPARAESFRATGATPAPTATVIKSEQRAPTNALPQFRAPSVEIHLDSASTPRVPESPSTEAVIRLAMDRQRASDTGRTDRTETKTVVSLPAPPAVEYARTAPKIIGRAPEPGFPDALLRGGQHEGEVIVRFIVNELGRADVGSMVVERSDHELFTAAVREVLPLFRFEPARTIAPEPKPVAAWVSVPFRFTTKRR
ncbi:MAG: tetratricopeptide repeat protein [Gemmatimonadaceae bacterium]